MKQTDKFKRSENALFLKRLLKNPKALGAVAPSSRALANFICRHVDVTPETYIVEIGAGTGRFTRALLHYKVTPAQLIVIEMDSELCHFLRQNFPEVIVIEGDASQMVDLLPKHVIGKISTIISGIPLVNLSQVVQAGIAKACFSVLAEDGQMIQFTYGPISPLSCRKLGLNKKRLGHVLWNLPPAVIWSYKRGYLAPKQNMFQRRLQALQNKMKKPQISTAE